MSADSNYTKRLVQGQIGIILAMDPQGVIGKDGRLPWHYKEDLRRFRRLTKDTVVLMGRKTFQSLPGPLKRRRCIVLSSNPSPEGPFQADKICQSLQEALAWAKGAPLWIIGGASVYTEALQADLVDVIDLTLVPSTSLTNALVFPDYQKLLTERPRFGLSTYRKSLVFNHGNLTHIRYTRNL